MRTRLLALVTILAAAIACGEHTAGEGNRNSGGAGGGAGSTATATARTTVTGCLERDERGGGYLLRTPEADTSAVPAGTAGDTPGKNAGSVFTGRGGDAIANSPTIGGHESAAQVLVVVPQSGTTDVSQYAGKRVSIDGVLQGASVLHASAIRVVAEDCSVTTVGR